MPTTVAATVSRIIAGPDPIHAGPDRGAGNDAKVLSMAYLSTGSEVASRSCCIFVRVPGSTLFFAAAISSGLLAPGMTSTPLSTLFCFSAAPLMDAGIFGSEMRTFRSRGLILFIFGLNSPRVVFLPIPALSRTDADLDEMPRKSFAADVDDADLVDLDAVEVADLATDLAPAVPAEPAEPPVRARLVVPPPRPLGRAPPNLDMFPFPYVEKKKCGNTQMPIAAATGSAIFASWGVCIACCSLLLVLSSGGHKRGGGDSIFGPGRGGNLGGGRGGGGGGTLLSLSCVSSLLLFAGVGSVCLLLLQRRRSFEANAALYASMMDVLERRQRASSKSSKSKSKPGKSVTTANANTTNVSFYRVDMCVLLGKVIAAYDSLEAAQNACIRNKTATHVQYDKTTKRAVVKSILQFPETYGDPAKDTAATLRYKCGEGYHHNYETHIHPRMFLLNQLVTHDWAQLVPADVANMAKTQHDRKDQLNAQCMLGNSGTCKWSGIKQGLFVGLGAMLAIAGVFVAGIPGLAGVVADVGVTSADVAVNVILPTALSTQQQNEANALATRFQTLKNGTAISNMYVGGRDSYQALFDRAQSDACTQYDAGTLTWKYYITDPAQYTNSKGGLQNGSSLAPLVDGLVRRMAAYEALPVAQWNCDEITASFRVSSRFGCCALGPSPCSSRANAPNCVRNPAQPPNGKTCAAADAAYTVPTS